MKQTMLIGSDGDSNYTFADATRAITITDISFTLEAKHVAYVFNITQNLLLYAPIDGFPGITVSTGVITYNFTKAALVTGDELHIQLYPPNHTAVDLVEEEDQVNLAETHKVLSWIDYKNGGLQFKLYAATGDDTVTATMWVSNIESADDQDDVDWVNKSAELIGSASIVANNGTTEEFHFLDSEIVALKFKIKIVYAYVGVGSENNSADVTIIRA